MLEGTEITSVIDGGKGKEAGWQAGDVILSVDGVKVADSTAIVEQLQRGDAKKTFVLKRGEEEIESVLDYSPGAATAKKPDEEKQAEEAAAKKE